MKNVDIGQLFNTLANIGVIAGIIFLGYELKQNTEIASQQARATLAAAKIAEQTSIATNAGGITEIWIKAIDGEPLTPSEFLQLSVSRDISLFGYSLMYREVQNGLLSKSDIPLNQWRYVLNLEPMREIWEFVKSDLDPDFVRFVEEEIHRVDP